MHSTHHKNNPNLAYDKNKKTAENERKDEISMKLYNGISPINQLQLTNRRGQTKSGGKKDRI